MIAVAKDPDTLVSEHIPLAKRMAYRKSLATPHHVSYADLRSAAFEGLLDAARKYDEAKDVPFRNYAPIRIHGAMQDYLRSISFGGRHGEGAKSKMVPLDMLFDEDYGYSEEFMDLEMPPEHTLSRMFSAEFFDVALAGLPAVKQEVFKMYYLEELTLKQISEKVGFSEAWVSKTMKNSLRHLSSVWTEQQLRELM